MDRSGKLPPDIVKPLPDDFLEFNFTGTYIFTKSKILRCHLVNSKLFHHINVIDHYGFYQLHGMDIHGEDFFIYACHDKGTLPATDVRIQAVFTPWHQE